MNTPPSRIIFCTLGVMLSAMAGASAWFPGTIPSPAVRMASTDLGVDPQNRVDVIAFWHAVYLASEGYETRINWTGNLFGNIGTTGNEFVADVERRVNYFRAMAGLPGDVAVNTGSRITLSPFDPFLPDPLTQKSTAAQSAALMMARNYNTATGVNLAITHNPASTLVGWSATSWNGAANGDLAFGLFGPGAINEYLIERFANNTAGSEWNSLVGHRRMILNPPATDFATGDQPGQGLDLPPCNVLYVFQNSNELVPPLFTQFVSYPSAGYLTALLNSPYWSLSRSGADFSAATVTMTTANGAPVPVSNVKSNNRFGDPALIWEVPPSAAIRAVTADTKFNVTVTGIAGVGVPASHSYSVTLINPKQLVSSENEASFPGSSHRLSGPASTIPSATSLFSFTPLAGAESLQIGTFLETNVPWKETAEVGNPARVIRSTVEAYPLIVAPTAFVGFGILTGNAAFRLTFTTQFNPVTRLVPEQSFELDREIVPKSAIAARALSYHRRNPFSLRGRDLAGPVIPSTAATLSFQFRRGYMTTGSSLAVEMSADDGANWSILGDTIQGLTSLKVDAQATTTTRALPVTGNPIRIRFRYFTTGGLIFIHKGSEKFPTGIFIDEITTTNCSQLEPKTVTTLARDANQFLFNAASAGTPLLNGAEWQIRLRSQVGGSWFGYGPAKPITISIP